MTKFKPGDMVKQPHWREYYEVKGYRADGQVELWADRYKVHAYAYDEADLIKAEGSVKGIAVGDKVVIDYYIHPEVHEVVALHNEWAWLTDPVSKAGFLIKAKCLKAAPKWEPKVGEIVTRDFEGAATAKLVALYEDEAVVVYDDDSFAVIDVSELRQPKPFPQVGDKFVWKSPSARDDIERVITAVSEDSVSYRTVDGVFPGFYYSTHPSEIVEA